MIRNEVEVYEEGSYFFKLLKYKVSFYCKWFGNICGFLIENKYDLNDDFKM